jgi:hypothetical protein
MHVVNAGRPAWHGGVPELLRRCRRVAQYILHLIVLNCCWEKLLAYTVLDSRLLGQKHAGACQLITEKLWSFRD